MSMRISMLILVTNTKSSSPTHTYTHSTGHPKSDAVDAVFFALLRLQCHLLLCFL